MTGLDSIDKSEPPLTIRFFCFKREDDVDPVLEGMLDWQDGVTIHDAEGIEPEDWSDLSACVLRAIKEAYTMLGDGPKLGGLRAPA